MIIAQSAATSRAFAWRYRETVDENADITGLAVANAAAAISGTFVVNGSPTQTAMADRAGARSQVAQLVFAAMVLLVLLFFTGPLQYLPRWCFGATVFTVAIGMIDLTALRDIRRESPGEFTLAAITAAAVVGIGVEQGILLAIALSLFRHVRHSYRPHTMMLIEGADGLGRRSPSHPANRPNRALSSIVSARTYFTPTAARFIDDVRELIEGAPTPDPLVRRRRQRHHRPRLLRCTRRPRPARRSHSPKYHYRLRPSLPLSPRRPGQPRDHRRGGCAAYLRYPPRSHCRRSCRPARLFGMTAMSS